MSKHDLSARYYDDEEEVQHLFNDGFSSDEELEVIESQPTGGWKSCSGLESRVPSVSEEVLQGCMCVVWVSSWSRSISLNVLYEDELC